MFALLLILAADAAAAATATPAIVETPAAVATATPSRNPLWAEKIDAGKGLPNFHKIGDNLYRGAQPDQAGFHELKKRGVKTVVNLRSFSSDREEIMKAALSYEHIYMKAWNAEDEEIERFLRIVTDPGRGPVFFHCKHGADRTGTMAAAYRIVVQGWTPEDAAKEMVDGGYGFHAVWPNLVKYVKSIDGPALRKKLNIPDPPAPEPAATP
jgi:protein tyrosine/serine phosphatase